MLWFLSRRWFVVDCFHWRGHVGCSSGYCLDTYKHMSLREINSQVNKQANAGLQRIRGQLAYMTPQNSMFTICLFISVKNMDIQRKLDVSSIRIQVIYFCLSHNHSYSYFQLVNTNTAEACLANQQMSSIPNFGKYHQLPKLSNIVSCQNWDKFNLANFMDA